MGCHGTLMPARAAKGDRSCGYAEGATLKFRIQPQFDVCEPFEDGRALVTKSGQRHYIDTSGKAVIPTKFAATSSFSEGLAAVRSQSPNLVGYIDRSGTFVIQPKYLTGADFHDGVAAVADESTRKVGLVDRSGTMVVPYGIDKVVCDFTDGRAVVWRDTRLQLIDTRGRVLTDWNDNREIQPLGGGMFEVKFGQDAHVIDRNGRIVTKGRYKEIHPYHLGYAVAMGQQQSSLLDRNGNEVLRPAKQLLGKYGGRYLTRINAEDMHLDLIDLTGTPRLRLQKGVLTRNPKP